MNPVSPSEYPENSDVFLYDVHYDDLRASGLSDETIGAEGFQSVDDVNTVAKELGWETGDSLERMGPFLRIPYRRANGSLMPYCRYKPRNPRSRTKDDGTSQIVKYEAPIGKSPPPYFPAGAIESINKAGATLFITEGEKKAATATQDGFSCIGLPGVSNWSKKRKENAHGKKLGRRHLNKWLRRIDWQGRDVFIVFDTDDRRNADVNREAAELARVLERHGAAVHILTLPTFWNEETGLYEKQGLDDYLVRYGSAALRKLIVDQTSEPATISLDDYRQAMRSLRNDISEPGLYLDSSPPGLGKSHCDVQAELDDNKMLMLVPTHLQCDSAVDQFTAAGKDAVKYPQRSKINCQNYPEVKRVEKLGLDASSFVCPKCPHKKDCAYHAACREAQKATVVIATHERFHRDGTKLTRGRKHISVHEDLINILASSVESDGFEQIVALAEWGAKGRWGAQIEKDYSEAAKQLLVVAKHCRDALQQHDNTMELTLPELAVPVENLNSHLNHLVADVMMYSYQADRPGILNRSLNGKAFQFCRLLLAGRIDRLCVRVTRSDNGYVEKKLVGILKISFPSDSVVILNDGTATLGSIPPDFRDQVRDITPSGQAERLQRIVQYPVDITKSDSSLLRLAGSIRAILHRYPDKPRVGLITHKKWLETSKGCCPLRDLLTPEENARLVKVDWFRGTESRGSNSWKEECDLLIVAGTPRVPASAVQNRLLQLGNPEAAARDGHWASLDYWSGRRLDGQRETVRSRGYRDHGWYEAARQIVHAELVQAIGRARPVCPDGIPLTIVLSTEPLGLPLADDKLEIIKKRIAQNAAMVFYHLLDYAGALNLGAEGKQVPDGDQEKITARNAYRTLKQNLPLFPADAGWDRCSTIKTPELTRRLGIPSRTARLLFADLERLGLLTREGVRKGWYLTANNLRLFERLPEYLFDEAAPTALPIDHEQKPAQEEPLQGRVMTTVPLRAAHKTHRQVVAPYITNVEKR